MVKHALKTLGEDGANVSGGQRQRIALARTLLGDADLILLDEITSALDAKSQERVFNTLRIYANNRFVLCVSHRVDSYVYFDEKFELSERSIMHMAK